MRHLVKFWSIDGMKPFFEEKLYWNEKPIVADILILLILRRASENSVVLFVIKYSLLPLTFLLCLPQEKSMVGFGNVNFSIHFSLQPTFRLRHTQKSVS